MPDSFRARRILTRKRLEARGELDFLGAIPEVRLNCRVLHLRKYPGLRGPADRFPPVTIPESTMVTVRTIDAIDSSTRSTGQTFRGSLDAPIVVGDQVVVPKGLNVILKLVNASSAGKFKGKSELTVSLESFTYQGKTYTLSTSDVQEKGASRGKRSAEVIGGGAALGALMGGLAGGGKGAAIGAGVGAGGGTTVQALT